MFTAKNKGRFAFTATVVGASLALAGCASGNPLDPGTDAGGDGGAIVIGSQAYYSNEIIAEIYAQALEEAGLEVERNFNIGQRDAYLPAIEAGEVDLFPEYTGNLLQYYMPETEATASDALHLEADLVRTLGTYYANEQRTYLDQENLEALERALQADKELQQALVACHASGDLLVAAVQRFRQPRSAPGGPPTGLQSKYEPPESIPSGGSFG